MGLRMGMNFMGDGVAANVDGFKADGDGWEWGNL